MGTVIPYEERLNRDRRWALMEGSMHFEKESAVFRTMREIARRLTALGIPYAVAGGMAMFQHGYRRFTEDVDILVTADGLERSTRSWKVRGTSRRTRAASTRATPIPGSGSSSWLRVSSPVTDCRSRLHFPDPTTVGVELNGVVCVRLPTLVELKLASGTAAWRLKDLGDVQDMIRVLNLRRDLADQLDPFVRDTYRQLWDQVHAAPPEE